MNQFKPYKILSVFLGSGLILGVLFYATAQASAAAASTRFNTLSDPTSLLTQAPSTGAALQASSVATLYLPIIRRSTLVYSQDFSDSDNSWPKGDDGKCASTTSGGRYQLTIDKDEECFRFAPTAAERTYGEFEVLLYHSGEQQNNSALGIYANGQGGNNYYLLRIWPNNSCTPTPQNTGGNWEFIRNRNGTKTIIRSGICNPNIIRGFGSGAANIIRVRHTSDRVITLYINGVQIDQFVESSSQELLGKGTGVYGRAASNKDYIITKYDDFKVYSP